MDGVPQIPEYYSQKQGRKIVDNDPSLGAILADPNGIALAVYGLLIVILLLVALAVRALVKRRQKAAKPGLPGGRG